MRHLQLLLAACCCVTSAFGSNSDTAPCWDSGKTFVTPWVHAGDKATFATGKGYYRVECLGGFVESTGGTPVWSASFVGTEAGKPDIEVPATYLVNSSTPYPERTVNLGTTDTAWSFVIYNANTFREIKATMRLNVTFSTSPFPTPAPAPAPQYSPADAHASVIYSAAAYAPPGEIVRWSLNESCTNATAGFKIARAYDGQEHDIYTPFAYTGIDETREWIVVAFKGTNGTTDTITDLVQIFSGLLQYDWECTINPHITGKTHKGFCLDYQVLQKMGLTTEVLELMKRHPSYKVVSLGHSLGGALAALFLADLATTIEAGPTPSELGRLTGYTYGQPRVGDAALAFNLPHAFRVTHALDIIPHLVPCCSDGDLCWRRARCPYHMSQEIWYPHTLMSPNSEVICSADNGEDPHCRYCTSPAPPPPLLLNFIPPPFPSPKRHSSTPPPPNSNSKIPRSIPNHLYYFGIHVGSYWYAAHTQDFVSFFCFAARRPSDNNTTTAATRLVQLRSSLR